MPGPLVDARGEPVCLAACGLVVRFTNNDQVSDSVCHAFADRVQGMNRCRTTAKACRCCRVRMLSRWELKVRYPLTRSAMQTFRFFAAGEDFFKRQRAVWWYLLAEPPIGLR